MTRRVTKYIFLFLISGFITSCAVTGTLNSKIEDRHFYDTAHSINFAFEQNGKVVLCLTASNLRAVQPVEYSLSIPYQELTSWYSSQKDIYLSEQHAAQWASVKPTWQVPEAAVDYGKCPSRDDGAEISIRNIASIEDLYDQSFLGWISLDEMDLLDLSIRERSNHVDPPYKSALLSELDNLRPDQSPMVILLREHMLYREDIRERLDRLYFFHPSLAYPDENHFAFHPPKRLVRGNKALALLLPFAYIADIVTFPVQGVILINSGH